MKRFKHSLSHYHLLTADMGKIIPLGWYEALPGDTIQHSTSLLLRLSPLQAPVMHPVRIRIHSFFVPNRLIWDDWENFITGGDGFTTYAPPVKQINTVQVGSLGDYLGLPVGTYPTTHNVSALPFRAYNLIFNEHYRDQDLVDPAVIGKGNGSDTTTDMDLLNCAWEKDYFTTARPWEQKGPEVTIPIGDQAPIRGIGMSSKTNWTQGNVTAYETGGVDATYAGHIGSDQSAVAAYFEEGENGYPNLYADLSEATGISVNDLRVSLALQRFAEARATYGSRYVEYLRYLGVKSSDARLQNPEYLGGGRQIVSFSEVLATAEGTETVVGDMKGHGIAAMKTRPFRRFFEEHGIVMTLASIVPKTIYTTALNRKWSRYNNMQYFQKELQWLGDQEVFVAEANIMQSGDKFATFGYVPKYDEYRYHPSYVSGEFQTILNYWHMAREYSGDIALNESFVSANPTKRIYADQTTNGLYIMTNHSIQARRMLAKNPTPRTF